MNELFALLHDLGELAFEIGRVAAGNTARIAWIIVRRLSIVTRLAIAWPFVLLVVALPSWKYWPVQYIVLSATVLILLAFLWMMTAPAPLSVFVAESLLSPKTQIGGTFVEKARKATNALRIVLGLELLFGIYLAWVPIANDRPLALTQILILAAIVCFVGIKKWKPIVAILAVAFCVITLVFFPWSSIDLGKIFAKTRDEVTSGQNKLPAGQPAAQASLTSPKKKTGSTHPVPPKGSGDPAGSPAGQPTPPPPPAPLAMIYPLSGDKGDLVPIMHDCYYSSGEVVTCEGSVINNDKDVKVGHGVYLMDSQGSTNSQDGRGEQFSVWTFGESLRFSGGTDFAQVIPGMPAPFVFSFRENTGRASLVGITLWIKTAADSINHGSTFANIPVFDHRP